MCIPLPHPYDRPIGRRPYKDNVGDDYHQDFGVEKLQFKYRTLYNHVTCTVICIYVLLVRMSM